MLFVSQTWYFHIYPFYPFYIIISFRKTVFCKWILYFKYMLPILSSISILCFLVSHQSSFLVSLVWNIHDYEEICIQSRVNFTFDLFDNINLLNSHTGYTFCLLNEHWYLESNLYLLLV